MRETEEQQVRGSPYPFRGCSQLAHAKRWAKMEPAFCFPRLGRKQKQSQRD